MVGSLKIANPERVEKIGAWATVAAVICAIDAWALRTGHPTLSEGHNDAISSVGGRIALAGVETVLLCHLWRFPKVFARIDPFSALARLVPTNQQGRDRR